MNANTKKGKVWQGTKNFETLKYNISDNTDILLDDSCEPDVQTRSQEFLRAGEVSAN